MWLLGEIYRAAFGVTLRARRPESFSQVLFLFSLQKDKSKSEDDESADDEESGDDEERKKVRGLASSASLHFIIGWEQTPSVHILQGSDLGKLTIQPETSERPYFVAAGHSFLAHLPGAGYHVFEQLIAFILETVTTEMQYSSKRLFVVSFCPSALKRHWCNVF